MLNMALSRSSAPGLRFALVPVLFSLGLLSGKDPNSKSSLPYNVCLKTQMPRVLTRDVVQSTTAMMSSSPKQQHEMTKCQAFWKM